MGDTVSTGNDAVSTDDQDGCVRDPARLADLVAIQDLAIAYGHAVDDRDWVRFEALFTADAHIDYTASGGITGSPAAVVAWMPAAMEVFTWCLHSISTHEIRFTGPDTASGRVHLFNRNGVDWEGEPELLDVIGLYLDRYAREGERWKLSERVEKVLDISGARFAELVRSISVLADGN